MLDLDEEEISRGKLALREALDLVRKIRSSSKIEDRLHYMDLLQRKLEAWLAALEYRVRVYRQMPPEDKKPEDFREFLPRSLPELPGDT